MTTISGAGAHPSVTDADRIPASQAGARGYHTVAALKADIAGAITSALPTYATHADAVADLANIAADAFVQVLADEDSSGHRTMYQKQSGILVFVLDFDVGASVMLEQFGGIGDGNPSAGTGTVNDSAMTNALAALYAAGGGELRLLSGCYRLTSDFVLPNDGSTNLVAKQPPLRITGRGHHCSGQGSPPTGGSILMWTAGNGGTARIVSHGLGTLTTDNVTYYSREGTTAGNGRPFFFTTNTTFKADQVAAWTQKGRAQCDDDFWVAGGTTTIFDNTDAAPFQGYGSIVTRCFFQGIRRGLYGRVYFNANRFLFNTFWNQCGSNLAVGVRSAIEIDGDPVNSVSNAVGNVVGWNLVEIYDAYDYGVRLKTASQTHVLGNDAYDASAQYVAMVKIEADCSATAVIAGQNANKPYVNDLSPVSSNAIISAEASTYSQFVALKAGQAGYPNLFATTKFIASAPSGNTIIQPAGVPANDAAAMLELLRSAADPSNAGQRQFSVNYGGGLSVNGNNAGNITNGLSSGASWSANGKTWGFPGASGGNMIQNSGTGGSSYTAQNNNFQWKDHTGALQAKLWSSAASGLGIGIDFGPSGDATLYKGSAAYLGVNVPFKLKSYTVATLPSASTVGGAGSLAYVSDATATTPRSTVAGGGSNKVLVFSDGTNWLIVV